MRKRVEWICVQTYAPPEMHARLIAIRGRTGLTLDYLVRQAIEIALPRLERAQPGVVGTGAGAGTGAR